ncbi:MAG: dadA [Rickettsiaceae bacterium]|jgi:hypothetical protein|nr:dadA [Rickettsiaceae bacterium]
MNKLILFILNLLAIFILLTANAFTLNQVEIRKVTPPKLEPAHLGDRILCHRPMRQGSPNMSISTIGCKVIAHNYGHGGSGWTLGPGTAAYVNNLLRNSEHAKSLKLDTPITIIGAGAIGLFTAYDLAQEGYKNITIIAERFDNLTSHNAGGLLAPVSMNNSLKMQLLIDQIGIDAYKFYELIAKGQHPHFKDGAVIVPTYFQTREESGLEPYVGVVMQKAKDVILDFGNGTTQRMVAYDDGIFIDTAKMMTALTNYLKPRVNFVQKKVTSFSEIKDKFIINCTGLGAKGLNKDSKMISVQGHLIMLKDQNPVDLQHMILVYFKDDKAESGHKVKRSFYMFPKKLAGSDISSVGVIGGTFIEGATSSTPNEKEFSIMLENAKKFYGIK